MNKFTLLTWLLGIVLLNGCIVPHKVTYIKDMMSDTTYSVMKAPLLRLQKNDRVQIIVSASTPELAVPFNSPSGSYNVDDNGKVSGGGDRSGSLSGYVVNQSGEIDFPVLGKIKIERLTLEEVRDTLCHLLIAKEFINNPTVKVELMNLKVSMMGAVGSQSVLQVPEAHITLLEAITRVGGLSIVADPQAVLVIREENGERKKYVNNIESKTIFDSPTYHLQQNDIVYVEPKTAVNTPREQRSMQYIGFGTGIFAFIVSLIALFK
jgi:Periplasmic protein involved in polysaccharide export